MNQEIIKRIDKAIKELSLIKLDLQKNVQSDIFEKPSVKCKYRDHAIEVINYMSELRIKHKLSSRVLKSNYSRIKLVTDRIKDSSVEDAKNVIKTRFHLWVNDEKQSQYLTIETLFRPSKYFKYVDDIERVERGMPKSFTDNQGETVVTGCWTD